MLFSWKIYLIFKREERLKELSNELFICFNNAKKELLLVFVNIIFILLSPDKLISSFFVLLSMSALTCYLGHTKYVNQLKDKIMNTNYLLATRQFEFMCEDNERIKEVVSLAKEGDIELAKFILEEIIRQNTLFINEIKIIKNQKDF